MNITKRTETEVRDSLHDAIDRMSIMEIVVLIFLVQMIRTREFVSHILPRPRKLLAEPTNDIAEFVEAVEEYNELATACTDPEPGPTFSYAEYYEKVMDAIRNNKPYPAIPSDMARISVGIGPARAGVGYLSAPLPPLPEPMFGIDSNGRYVRVGELREEPAWAMCTPSRGQLTGYPRCTCSNCQASYESVHVIPR